MTIRLSEDELQSILAEAEAELKEVLKSQGDRLAKAQVPGEDDGADEGSAPAPESSGPPMDEGSASPEASAPEGSADPAGAPPMDGGPEASASADPAAGQQMDPQALEAEYAQLPPEQLKVHYLAAKSALFKLMGGGAQDGMGAGPEASAPPPGAAPAGPAPAPAPAMKGEMSAGKQVTGSPANGGMVKSEHAEEISFLRAELKKNEEGLNLLATALDRALGTPLRKAVTTVNHVPKGNDESSSVQSLSKSEISEILSEKARDPKLAKSDRELINKFYAESIGVEKITHLLQ